MRRLEDVESKAAVGKAPGDTDGHDETGSGVDATQTTPWETGVVEEATLRDRPTSRQRRFPEALTIVAALVALGLGLPTAGVIGDRIMQRRLDEAASERAEADAEAKVAEALRRETVVEKCLVQRVENAATDEERAEAEQALADWRKDHPGLASNALQAEAGK